MPRHSASFGFGDDDVIMDSDGGELLLQSIIEASDLLSLEVASSMMRDAPGVLASIWAPVGLRYHALHHLLPSVPYHALGEAHRRLTAQLAPDSVYHRASYNGLAGLVYRLTRSTLVRGA